MTGARSRIDVLAAVGVGGVIGATARYALSEVITTSDDGFPFATLVTNVVGSFILGLLLVAGADVLTSRRRLQPFLTVGVIGSFTTFSTFAVENVTLVDRGHVVLALIYVPAMLVSGLTAARLGIAAGRRVRRVPAG